jgi:hypothetical protein
MDIAMQRHEASQKKLMDLRALQLQDHLEKIKIDNEIR